MTVEPTKAPPSKLRLMLMASHSRGALLTALAGVVPVERPFSFTPITAGGGPIEGALR